MNNAGQLGDGTITTRTSPAIAQVAACGDNTYALVRDGSLWAWGDDAYGQIGNTVSAKAQATPLKVTLAGVKSVGAGGTHALALTIDGAAWAWGNNNTGQLGDGGVCGKTCPTPVKVTALTGATALTGGYVHSLAAIGDGTARGWGRNAEGEVGDGTTTVRATPVAVTGLSGITATTSTSISAAYTYDGHGTRTSRTIGALTQRFAWDTHAGLSLVLTDGTTSYLYDDAGTPIEQVNTAGVTLYYGHDQYGSTRLLTDGAGAVAATFTYDPYGNLTAHTGTADTPLRWNGQYQDADTGLYYLRARYYDPVTAQFLTRDPLTALTLAAYAFGGGNPLNMIDPLGLWGCSETLGTIGAVAGVVAIVAAGPVALGFAAVAIGAGFAATGVDLANGAPAWQIALDAVGVIPGAGAIGLDVKTGVFAARSSFALRNIGEATWWDLAAADYGAMASITVDANSLTEEHANQTRTTSPTPACAP